MRLSIPLLLGFGLIAACFGPTQVCGCSPVPPASGIVFGIVEDAGGAPVVGALVGGTARQGACPGAGPSISAVYGSQVSDSAGRYRAYAQAGGNQAESTICVQFSARRTVAVNADSVLAQPVSMRVSRNSFDSVRVDFSFP